MEVVHRDERVALGSTPTRLRRALPLAFQALWTDQSRALGRAPPSLPWRVFCRSGRAASRRRPCMARPVRNPAGLEPAPTHTHPLSAANGCMRTRFPMKKEGSRGLSDHEIEQFETLLSAFVFGQIACQRLDTQDSLFNRVARDLSVDMRNHWRPGPQLFRATHTRPAGRHRGRLRLCRRGGPHGFVQEGRSGQLPDPAFRERPRRRDADSGARESAGMVAGRDAVSGGRSRYGHRAGPCGRCRAVGGRGLTNGAAALGAAALFLDGRREAKVNSSVRL
jgi:hypothetical protein